jgi:MFS family permease
MPFTSCWRDVYLATTARALSSCGDILAATALVLALQKRGAGGFAVAAVLIAAAAPPVLLVRWTGRLTDRVDSRVLLVVTGLGQAGICLALAFTSGVVEIISLVSVLAAGLAVTRPCLSALLPLMVRTDDLPRATALGQTANAAGMLIAPALAGLLIGRFGLRVPLLADAASYLAIAAAGGLLRARHGIRPEASAHGTATPATDWRFRKDPLLWATIVLLGAVVAATSLVNVADVFFVRETLHAPPTVYGLLVSAWIAAMAAGGWLLGRRSSTDASLGLLLLGALTLTCLAVAVTAAAPSAVWLAPAYLIGGLGNGGVNVAAGVLLGRRSPAAVRGHTFAVAGAVGNAASAFGYFLGGLLLALVPVRASIAAAGIFGLAATAAFTRPVLRAAAHERAQSRRPAPPGASPSPEAASPSPKLASPEAASPEAAQPTTQR